MTKPFGSAIVIGGSIAGLLTARVLSDYFNAVTIIERDELQPESDFRGGVPQARHLHTLLIKGEHILMQLFPGFQQDLEAAGAVVARWGLDSSFLLPAGWTLRFDMGLTSHIITRGQLEKLVRQRITDTPNITFSGGYVVEGLLTDADKKVVEGVHVKARSEAEAREFRADLVVDASGRTSKAPEWLKDLGYEAPPETVIDAHCGYATRWYERPLTTKPHTIAIQARPGEGHYRGGGIMPVEGGRWVVTLLGGNSDFPPTDEDGFLSYAASLPDTSLYEIIKDAKPISPIYGYRRLENRMRHYERLQRRPEQFIVIGDAACALNPIYGQGMSTAALEAEALGQLLARTTSLTGFAQSFQKRLAQVIKGPWLMATSEDMRYPGVEGAKPDWITRMGHRYLDQVVKTIPYDSQMARVFTEVINLLQPFTIMMRPDLIARVLWYALRPPKQAHPNASIPKPAELI